MPMMHPNQKMIFHMAKHKLPHLHQSRKLVIGNSVDKRCGSQTWSFLKRRSTTATLPFGMDVAMKIARCNGSLFQMTPDGNCMQCHPLPWFVGYKFLCWIPHST